MDLQKQTKALQKALLSIAAITVKPAMERVLVEVSESKAVEPVARRLQEGAEGVPPLRTLVHLGVFHDAAGDLVFSALLDTRGPETSREESAAIVLRWRVQCGGSEERVGAPTLRGVWPSAPHFEAEIAALFGVTFRSLDGTVVETGGHFLPTGWVGFPLRKGYLFPAEFLDIPHARPAGQTAPDEHAGAVVSPDAGGGLIG